MSANIVVGVDVSKDELDAHVRPSGQRWRRKNTTTGRAKLADRLAEVGATLVVLEASGGYERAFLRDLAARNIPFAVVNPRRVREFAKAMGIWAKTDSLDASVVAHYGEVARPEPQRLPTESEEQLRDVVDRRSQLVDLLVAEKNRWRQTASGRASQSLLVHIEWLTAEVSELDKELEGLLTSTLEFQKRAALLRTTRGIGPVVTAVLLAHLPELGKLTGKQIASLVGVAPFNDDSGERQGKRRCWGGREPVRRALYMATLAAIRHGNEAIAPFYKRLVAFGKPKKVGLVAAMRKLLVRLNAMIHDGQPWRGSSPHDQAAEARPIEARVLAQRPGADDRPAKATSGAAKPASKASEPLT